MTPSPSRFGCFPTMGRRKRGGCLRRPRLELDQVAVGIAQVDGGPVAPRAEALDHVTLERDRFPAQRLGDRFEIVAWDGQTEVIGPARPRLGGGQEVDQRLAEPQVDQRDPLVEFGERAAQHIFVEATRPRLIANPQDDVIEAERLEHRHLHHCTGERLPRGAHSWRSTDNGLRPSSPTVASKPTASATMDVRATPQTNGSGSSAYGESSTK